MPQIPSIGVDELKRRRAAGETLALIDVREPHETAFASIEDSIAIPLRTLPASLSRIPNEIPVILYCHHGGRSAQAAMFLATRGFSNVFNLDGGIDEWSLRIDPAVPRY